MLRITCPCVVVALLVVSAVVDRSAALSAVRNKNPTRQQHPKSINADASSSSSPHINFEDWITNAPQEIREWKSLRVEPNSAIPPYVRGTLIRNGNGLWSNTDDQYGHIFDGLAKVSAYRITDDNHDNEPSSNTENTPQVLYRNEFIRSNWYNLWKKDGIPPSVSVGPIVSATTGELKLGWRRVVSSLFNSIQFDNAPVNIWDFGVGAKESNDKDEQQPRQVVCALTDAPPRAVLAVRDLQTVSSKARPPPCSGTTGYELSLTTHPEYSKRGDQPVRSFNVAVEIGLGGPRINLVEEWANGTRHVLGQSDPIADGVPYLHSFGVTQDYAVVVLQPLRYNFGDLTKLINLGIIRSMKHVDQTRVLVFDLNSGSVVADVSTDEKFYFYHAISAAQHQQTNEDGKAVVLSLRLCAFKTPDMITGENPYMRIDLCQKGKEWRNRIPKGGQFCDVVCTLPSSSSKKQAEAATVSLHWRDHIAQHFEMPTTRYSRAHGAGALSDRHPRFVYAMATYVEGSDEYDAFGLYKYDLEMNGNKGGVAAFYRQDARYVSEPVFVVNPAGTSEDDGILLSQMYDGIRRETALLVLNAQTMKEVACVWTGNRSPMDLHGVWIPAR